jgi:DNA-binding transcriptional ArsR family regulator
LIRQQQPFQAREPLRLALSTSTAAVRFSSNPMLEALASYVVLRGADADASPHRLWLARARRALGDLRLPELDAVADGFARTRRFPEFLVPDTEPAAAFDRIVERIRQTTRIQAERDVAELGGAVTDAAFVHKLAAQLERYWERALAPHWPHIAELHQSDLLALAGRLASDGYEGVFGSLGTFARVRHGIISIDLPHTSHTARIAGEVTLCPTVFAAPDSPFVHTSGIRTWIAYPPRSIELLWSPAELPPAEALARALGRGRASVLAALTVPRSTQELAGLLRMTPSAVSQHLKVLSETGLVRSSRIGRRVFYARSQRGEALTALFEVADGSEIETERPAVGALPRTAGGGCVHGSLIARGPQP